ncbi:TetR/AcrR family transcriptional regulator [Kribbella solani]|uniref:AcrR family transcriptional regulator n=1 Tax=Kribbella solani TaxID=236067 RepID=A0A841DN64_9ACTN|nr:TetR/AcrR family transcriptional regulator [Kribbella solani]MBB5978110.1 AcrR family transcriptional regulator [Kribbella solani]MDX2967830.1 TetR/AcrR family transcriptional regulator [Kribbella solani]MDX3005350.1 TetR/AcrR family transcriptional regulator [Kribbella solani]
MPTGVALRDAREQLFDAAERVLLREGPDGLTSRAVTTEAGCAKGVLHKYFTDFDGFLAELVLDRIRRLDGQAEVLLKSAGQGSVAGNLTAMLTELFGSVAVAIVSLTISRDSLRARLRAAVPTGVPILTEAGQVLLDYLAAEQKHGRIPPEADLNTLGLTLIGSTHLLFADRTGTRPTVAEVRAFVESVLPR